MVVSDAALNVGIRIQATVSPVLDAYFYVSKSNLVVPSLAVNNKSPPVEDAILPPLPVYFRSESVTLNKKGKLEKVVVATVESLFLSMVIGFL